MYLDSKSFLHALVYGDSNPGGQVVAVTWGSWQSPGTLYLVFGWQFGGVVIGSNLMDLTESWVTFYYCERLN